MLVPGKLRLMFAGKDKSLPKREASEKCSTWLLANKNTCLFGPFVVIKRFITLASCGNDVKIFLRY